MSSGAMTTVRGVVLPTGREVEGLACPPGEVTFLGRTLAERQERALLAGGARPGPDDTGVERVVLPDDIALLPGTVRALVALGRREGRAVAVRPAGELGRFVDGASFGDPRPLAGYLPPGPDAAFETLQTAALVELPARERLLNVPLHRTQFGTDLVQIPIAEHFLFPARHWLQALWANLLGLGPFLWAELVGTNAPRMIANLAWAWLGCWTTDPFRIGAQLGKHGRGGRIHPSAVVEGCWLGDGVEIGANAVVRGSVLCAGARVEELAVVDYSALGRQAVVQRQAMVRFCVLERGCACAGQMQLGVLGRESALKHGSTLMDSNFVQGVRVRAAGSLHAVPLGLAGVCVGPRTVIGSGIRIASGRAVPPDLVVLPGRTTVLSAFPEPCPAGTYHIAEGGLERA